MKWPKRLRTRLLHPSILGALVVVAGASAVGALGLTDLSVGWALAGTVALTLAGFLLGRTLESTATSASKVRDLGATVVILGLVLAASWLYPILHRVKDEPRFFTLAHAKETQCLNVGSRPGGPPLNLAPSLCGGTPYAFDCELKVRGIEWLKLSNDPPYWVPRSSMEPVTAKDGDVPDC